MSQAVARDARLAAGMAAVAAVALLLAPGAARADDDIKFQNNSGRTARLVFRERGGDMKGTYTVRPGQSRRLDDGKGHDKLTINGVTRRIDSWGYKRNGDWYINYGYKPRPRPPVPGPPHQWQGQGYDGYGYTQSR